MQRKILMLANLSISVFTYTRQLALQQILDGEQFNFMYSASHRLREDCEITFYKIQWENTLN